MITLIGAMVTRESWESVLFQPVSKAYSNGHSWIITAHVSLGNLENQWRMFIKQMERTQQLLDSVQQMPLAPTYMISTLQAELTNLESIHTSNRPLILAATQLLRRAPSFDGVSTSNRCPRRSILPFLGDALSWLMKIKIRTHQQYQEESHPLIANTQTRNLVHIIPVLNVTRYATQVNRQDINIVMGAVERTRQDVTTLYNITSSMYNSLSYQPIHPSHPLILANMVQWISWIS